MMQFNGLVYHFSLPELYFPIRPAGHVWKPRDFVAAMHPNDEYGRAILDACCKLDDAGHAVHIVVQTRDHSTHQHLVRIAMPRATMDAWEDDEGARKEPPPVPDADEEFVAPSRRMKFRRPT